jgi:hypothetical protein
VSAGVVLPPPPPAPQAARRSRATVLALFGGAIAGAIVLAMVLTLLNSADTSVEKTCVYPDPCGPPVTAAELVTLTSWESPLGFSFRYDASVWTVADQDDASATLAMVGADDAALRIAGASGTSPQAAIDGYLADVRSRVPDLAEDGRAFRLVLGPAVGYVNGVGASYSGHVQTPQGPGPIVTMSVMAADVGGVTVLASMGMVGEHWIQMDGGAWEGEGAFDAADSVINTVRWAAGS